MMKKIKVIALFGPAGAGKDLLQEIMVRKHGLHGIVSYTTRPIRENEKEGVAYHFVTRSEFKRMMAEDKFLESRSLGKGCELSRLGLLRSNIDSVISFSI